MPSTHIDIPYFAIVYASIQQTSSKPSTVFFLARLLPAWSLNHLGVMYNGGDRVRMCGFLDFLRYGMASFELEKVDLSAFVRLFARLL
jgi:hypothetical protein